MLCGQWLRDSSYHAVEALVGSKARRSLGIRAPFGDDALGYFTERLDAEVTRQALGQVLSRAKRNKTFDDRAYIGLAVDGSGAGFSRKRRCPWCRPVRNAQKEIVGYGHRLAMISVVGVELSLPFDVEPYGPGDSEYAAGKRLLRRAVGTLGRRFADYVVGDGEYATAPFLNLATELGLKVVARLKGNLPELYAAAQRRFDKQPPSGVFEEGGERIEVWDADDFDPWDGLRWETVRVLRYRQHKANGEVVEAYWLTDFSTRKVGSRTLYRMAKSRWEIENQGFNDAKNRQGLEHIRHHRSNSMVVDWLLTLLAMVIERLYRVRYLHRGKHRRRTAIELVRLLRLSLARIPATNSS
jgi:hypothetical protein